MNARRLGYRLTVPGNAPAAGVRDEPCHLYVSGMSRIGHATCWHLLVVRGDDLQQLTIASTTARWSLTPPDHLIAASLRQLARGPGDRPAATDPIEF